MIKLNFFALIILVKMFVIVYSVDTDFEICFPSSGPFKNYFPPKEDSVEDADEIYSVSTNERISRPIIAYLCNPNSTTPISINHPMYSSEANVKMFKIQSHPVKRGNTFIHGSIKLCQFAANDFDISDPKRFDVNSRYFKTYCSEESQVSNNLTLSSVSIRGNMLIAQGLYHVTKNVKTDFLLRKIVFSVSNAKKEKFIYTNPIKIFSRIVRLDWIEPKHLSEIPANHPFNISLKIIDSKTNEIIQSGLDSTLIIEVTIAYQHKLFHTDRLIQDFLHTTDAKLAGDEVMTSHRNYDEVLHKRAEKGFVQFNNVVIEDINKAIFLNATLIMPRTGNRVPNGFSELDRKCLEIKEIDNEYTYLSSLYCEVKSCTANMPLEHFGDQLYTWDENCEQTQSVKFRSIIITQQKADRLELKEIRNSEVEYVLPHFQIPGLWVIVVDKDGRRIFSGPDASLSIAVRANQNVTFCKNDSIFKTNRGLARYMGAVCETASDVRFHFVSILENNIKSDESKNYTIGGVVNIALFGRFNTAGLTNDPDPVFATFAKLAINDINNNQEILKDQLSYLIKSKTKLNLKIYNTDQNYTVTYNAFCDMILESELDSREKIMGIIGFGSHAITRAVFALVGTYNITVLTYREFWRQFGREIESDFLCSISWNEGQIANHLKHFAVYRQWTSIAIIEDTNSSIHASFRDKMIRHNYNIVTLVIDKQTNLTADINKLKKEGIKTIFSHVHAPKQYFVYREAIKNKFTCLDGYQWMTYGLPAKNFDWENKHPFCAMKPTCTDAFEGMMLLHSAYNISLYATPLWYQVNRNYFEMNIEKHYGLATSRSEIVNGVIALGYDTILAFAHALNRLMKANDVFVSLKEMLQAVEFYGLTGKVKFSKKDCQRVGVVMALTTVAKNIETANEIIPSVFYKNLITRWLMQSDVYDSTLMKHNRLRKRDQPNSILTLDNFQKINWFLEQNVEATQVENELFGMPYRPSRLAKQPGYIIHFYLSTRGYITEDGSLVSHKDTTNLTHLCIRTEITTYSKRCIKGCGGGRIYTWNPWEYKHGKCVDSKCECKLYKEGDKYLSGYSGEWCGTIICHACLNGICKSPYNCVCQTGWTGYQCDQPICLEECVHGICKSPNYCECNISYYGLNCKLPVGTFAAVITISILVALIIVIVCLRYITKTKAHQESLRNLDWIVDWKDVKEKIQSQPTTASSSIVTGSKDRFGTVLTHSSGVGSITNSCSFKNSVEWKGIKYFAKKFDCASLDINSREFRMEVINLKKLKHNNLVTFIGICTTAPNVALLVELMPKGSITDILVSEAYNLTWAFKYSILVDIANGMSYLHDSKIGSHGRLKSTNCLIDNKWTCKVTDFGIQSIRSINYSTDFELQTAMLWTAPELLRSHSSPNEVGSGTKRGDVYSYGIIITELCARDSPFAYELQIISLSELFRLLKSFYDPANMGIKKFLETHHYNTSVPIRPLLMLSDLPLAYAEKKGIQDLIAETTDEDPNNRPTFKQVLDKLTVFFDTSVGLVQNLIYMLENYTHHLEEVLDKKLQQIEIEKNKTAELIARLLPQQIVDRLKLHHDIRPQFHESVTILYSDLVGFTTIARDSKPIQVVEMLNDLYTSIDSILVKFNVYKLETIGDAYCIVSGLPEENVDHYEQIAVVALYILSTVSSFTILHMPHKKIQIRIGIHTGSCVAGVVGVTMPRYCIFSEDVLIAQCMESQGEPDAIQVSAFTAALLEDIGSYYLLYRTILDIQYVGSIATYWLLGKEGFNLHLPINKFESGSSPKHSLSSRASSFGKSSRRLSEFLQRTSTKKNTSIKESYKGLMEGEKNLSLIAEENVLIGATNAHSEEKTNAFIKRGSDQERKQENLSQKEKEQENLSQKEKEQENLSQEEKELKEQFDKPKDK